MRSGYETPPYGQSAAKALSEPKIGRLRSQWRTVDLPAPPERPLGILGPVSRGEWLPWRRDWSKYPNAWKTYLVGSVAFGVLSVTYLLLRDDVGLGYLVLASVLGVLSRYSFRKSRLGAPPEQRDPQPQ